MRWVKNNGESVIKPKAFCCQPVRMIKAKFLFFWCFFQRGDLIIIYLTGRYRS